MWWEILPSAGIMAVVASLAVLIPRNVNKAVYNVPSKRDISCQGEWYYFQRDRNHSYSTIFTRLHGQKTSEGCPYHSHGLEAIPDGYKRMQ